MQPTRKEPLMRTAAVIVLTSEDSSRLREIVADETQPEWLRKRAEGLLFAADGQQSRAIADRLRVGEHTVGRWRAAYLDGGLEGLLRIAPRPGAAAGGD